MLTPMNEYNLRSIRLEIDDPDAKALFDFLVHEYWELPHKWLGRAARKLGWDAKRAEQAKRRLYMSGYVGPKGYSDRIGLVHQGKPRWPS